MAKANGPGPVFLCTLPRSCSSGVVVLLRCFYNIIHYQALSTKAPPDQLLLLGVWAHFTLRSLFLFHLIAFPGYYALEMSEFR